MIETIVILIKPYLDSTLFIFQPIPIIRSHTGCFQNQVHFLYFLLKFAIIESEIMDLANILILALLITFIFFLSSTDLG